MTHKGRWRVYRAANGSDEWGSATCLRCNRKINLNRHGQFRRHMKEKGSSCNGTYEYPEKQVSPAPNE